MAKCLPDTDIYAILSRRHSAGRTNIETARKLLEAGIKIIQYREKEACYSVQLEECLFIKSLCVAHGACFIINDDVKLALKVNADGLHMGQEDYDPAEARAFIGVDFILGLSVRNKLEIEKARDLECIDYLGVGPVYSTNTKENAAPPGGLDLVDFALMQSSIPVVAIGGINLSNISPLVRRGVPYFALISGLLDVPDIRKRVNEIRALIHKERTQTL